MTLRDVGVFLAGWAFFRVGNAIRGWLGRRRLRLALQAHAERVQDAVRGLIGSALMGARPNVPANWDAMVAAETGEDCGHEDCRAARAVEVEAARRGAN